MNEGLIPRRYAKALYKYASEKGVEESVYGMMKNIEQCFSEMPTLQEALSNPFISVSDKEVLIITAARASEADSCLTDFLKLLAQNRRIDMMRGIAAAYVGIYRQSHNIHVVDVVSASELQPAEESRLKQLIQSHLKGASMEYSHSVNPDLLGGFVVNIDNERLDASISNELKQLRLKLLSK